MKKNILILLIIITAGYISGIAGEVGEIGSIDSGRKEIIVNIKTGTTLGIGDLLEVNVSSGKIIIEVTYPMQTVAKCRIKGKGNYMDMTKGMPVYRFSKDGNKTAEVKKKDNVIWLVEPKFEEVGHFQEGLASVKINGKWGFINMEGKIIIEPKFDYPEYSASWLLHEFPEFSEGLAAVQIKGKWGYINTEGKVVIKPKFKNLTDFHEGLAFVQDVSGGDIILINSKGDYLRDDIFSFESGRYFSEGLAYVAIRHGKYDYRNCYINEKGEITINCTPPEGYAYHYYNFYNGWAKLLIDNYNTNIQEYYYINKQNQKIGPFEETLSFNQGMASVKKNGKWGAIDISGRLVIKYQYDSLFDFDRGIACVDKNSKIYFIDTSGKIIPKKNLPEDYFLFTRLVSDENKKGFKNIDNKYVITPRFDDVCEFYEGFAAVCKDGKWGFIYNPLLYTKKDDKVEMTGKNPLGKVIFITDTEVVITSKLVSSWLFPSDRLCLYLPGRMILLRVKAVNNKEIKCELITGNINDVQIGMNVYKDE